MLTAMKNPSSSITIEQILLAIVLAKIHRFESDVQSKIEISKNGKKENNGAQKHTRHGF